LPIPVLLEHETTYRFDRAVRLAPHVVRLRPAPHTVTPIHAYAQHVSPEHHTVSWHQDPFGNHVARYVFGDESQSLAVRVELRADLTPTNPFDFLLEPTAEDWPVPYEPALASALLPYLGTEQASVQLHGFLAEVRAVATDGQPTTDVLVAVNNLVHERVGYEVRMQPGVQSPDETLSRGIGSCRDSSWLLVQVLRSLGMATRFTSGYLIQLAVEDSDENGPPPREEDEDFGDLHAWAEVYLPGAGWVGLDPTSGLLTAEGHIPVAAANEPSLAAAITGTTSPARVDLGFTCDVTRLEDAPGSPGTGA